MKIIFLNPPYGENFVRSARWAAKSRGRVQRHPEIALTSLAYLKQFGHEVKFIEGAARNLTKEQISDEILNFQPDMTVVHTTTPSIYNDISYAQLAKELSGCLTVLVGPHVTAEVENTFAHSSKAVDAVAKGEYDYTLRDLAGGQPLEKIKGIAWKNNNDEIIHNPSQPPVDVNELPFPDWQQIDPRWYHDAAKRYPFLTLFSGRGCFGRCTFCRDTQVIYGRCLRQRDPQKVVAEMEYDLKLFPHLKEIMFETDTFTATADNVKKICQEIIKSGLNKKISWSCNVRVDIELDLLPLMKEAGCRMLMVGFEFGTQKMLDAVKKDVTLEQSREFARTAHRLGFIIHGCFMIGGPGETPTTAQQTIDFAKSLPLDTIQISGICVYPGTELYRWAKDNSYLLPKDWTGWVNNNKEQITVLDYPQMSKEQIDYYIDKGLREFYLRPRQIIKMALNIKTWDDIKRKFYGLKSFLNYLHGPKPQESNHSSV